MVSLRNDEDLTCADGADIRALVMGLLQLQCVAPLMTVILRRDHAVRNIYGGSKMSEIGSVHFSYQALTFYLQNIERADATARAKRRQTQQTVFARFFWEMSCKIWLEGG